MKKVFSEQKYSDNITRDSFWVIFFKPTNAPFKTTNKRSMYPLTICFYITFILNFYTVQNAKTQF